MDEMYPTSRMDFSSELDKRPFPKLLELGGFHATEDSSVCGTLSWVNQLFNRDALEFGASLTASQQ